MENHRLLGLESRVDEIVVELREYGLMNADFEVMGAIMFNRFKGSDNKLSEMFENTRNTLKEAEELLKRLRDGKY